jgi:hypothetical protein
LQSIPDTEEKIAAKFPWLFNPSCLDEGIFNFQVGDRVETYCKCFVNKTTQTFYILEQPKQGIDRRGRSNHIYNNYRLKKKIANTENMANI